MRRIRLIVHHRGEWFDGVCIIGLPEIDQPDIQPDARHPGRQPFGGQQLGQRGFPLLSPHVDDGQIAVRADVIGFGRQDGVKIPFSGREIPCVHGPLALLEELPGLLGGRDNWQTQQPTTHNPPPAATASTRRCCRPRRHAPEPVPGTFLVPHGSRFEEAGVRHQMPAHHIFIERYAQSRFIGHGNEAFVDDGLVDAFHQVLPPGHIQRVIFAREEILGGRGAVHAGQRADRQTGVVHGHGDAILHRGIADLMGLQDAARRWRYPDESC